MADKIKTLIDLINEGVGKRGFATVCDNVNLINSWIEPLNLQKGIVSKSTPTHYSIADAFLKSLVVFSYYKDLNYEFQKGNANGAYYTNFIKTAKSKGFEPLKMVDANKIYTLRGPRIYINEKYDNKSTKCWAYDINNAYASGLLEDIPNTMKDYGAGIVEENQIGYIMDVGGTLTQVQVGEYALFRFDLINSPFRDWAIKKDKQRRKAKKEGKKEEADKIKASLVIAIGILATHDPFLYQFIIDKIVEKVGKYIDEYTIRKDTDCIFSARPRTDLPIGDRIGEFKELPQNGTEIYIDGALYEWGDKKALPGVPRGLQDSYDLKTKTQTKTADYYFDGGKICST